MVFLAEISGNLELIHEVCNCRKNPRNAIRPSGKRKRKVLKRLRHGEKEKSIMQGKK